MANLPEHFGLSLLAAPTVEPVSIADLMAMHRVDDPNDPAIPLLLAAARSYVEKYSQIQLMPAIWQMSLDMFPQVPYLQFSPGLPGARQPLVNFQWPISPDLWAIRVLRPPLKAVVALNYVDTGGNAQTLAPSAYLVDSDSPMARIVPTNNGAWPGTLYQPNAVMVQYVAGHGTAFTAAPSGSTVTIPQSADGTTPTPSPTARGNSSTYQVVNIGGLPPAPLVNGSLYRLTPTGPGTYTIADPVTGSPITLTAAGTGYNYFSAIPENFRQAIQLLVGTWYENREDANGMTATPMPFGVKALLGLDRVINV